MAKKKEAEIEIGSVGEQVDEKTARNIRVENEREQAAKPRRRKKVEPVQEETQMGLSQESESGTGQTGSIDNDNSREEEDSESFAAQYNRMQLQWIEGFKRRSVDEQQNLLYNLINERLYWKIIYYIRRFPERLTSSRSTYTDRCVGAEELMAYMGFIDPNGYSNQWVESHHIPSKSDAQNRLIVLDAQIDTLLDVESSCAIASIKKNFALNHQEVEILGTLIAAMSEQSLLRLMTVAWADFSVRLPTVTFISSLLSDEPERTESIIKLLSESGTLRRMRLVIAERHAAFPNYTPLAYTPLSVEQNVIDAYLGRDRDTDLPPNMTIHRQGIPRRAVEGVNAAFDELEYILNSPSARVCLLGPVHAGRRTMLCSIAHYVHHKAVLEVDACREFERVQPQEIEARISSIMRESLLSGCLLLLRFDGLDDKSELLQRLIEHQTQIARLISYYPGRVVILANKVMPFFDDAFGKPTSIHILPPTVEDACKVWKRALEPWCDPDSCNRMAEMFSRNYSLPIGSIFTVVRDASDAQQSLQGDMMVLQSHHVLNEIRKSFRHQMGALAEVTVSDVPLSGVVLPQEAKAQVNEILEYAKNLHNVLDVWGFRQRSPYGNALSVLFAGPPGTGKTLLACALANELGKVLYRVDLSRIVDKYIGETEKNLGRIFDEAAKAQAIILFDEADSLFAKRTEVKSSNDRYANLEINFLLQKLESYNGITILTTNLSKSIDEAFRRRLRFIIDFPMPDVPSRVALWKRMMPPSAPLSEDIRWSWLARTFEMSGGYIRNAVLKAAITASAAHQPISMQHLAKAAADEARSMGKLMRIDDFNDYDDDDENYD